MTLKAIVSSTIISLGPDVVIALTNRMCVGGGGSDAICLPKISHKRIHGFFMAFFLSGHS